MTIRSISMACRTAVALLFMPFMALAALSDGYNYTETVGDYTWTFSIINGEAEIGVRDGYGNEQWQRAVEPYPSGALTVPDTLGGCNVTRLGYAALNGCGAQSLALPETLQEIGDYAVWNCCSLTSVNLPNGVTFIGDYAFYACWELAEGIDISSNVTFIGEYTFSECTSLRNLTVSSDNAYYSSDDGVLYDRNKTELYFWPSQKRIEFPTTLRNIRAGACEYNYAMSGETLTFPSSVTNICDSAFANCSMSSVALNEGLVSIGSYAFGYNDGLSSVVIPSTVTNVAGHVFCYCHNLTSVFFKGNAPKSANAWFYGSAPGNLVTFVRSDSTGWTAAESSELPETWPARNEGGYGEPRAIRTWTTYPDVAHLVRFDLGEGATRDGGGELEQMVYEGGVASEPTLACNEGYEFYRWSKDFSCISNSIVVSASYRKDGKLTDGYNYTETVGDYTWTFSIINGEAEIGVMDADGNEQWRSAVEPNPSGALTVPDTLGGRDVTRLGYAALNGCGAQSLALPEALRCMGYYAVAYAYNLRTIVVPSTVTNVASYVFNGCSGLTSVFFKGNAPESANAWFYGDAPGDLVTFVRSDSTGWTTAGSSELPETWPAADEWGNGEPRAIRTWTTYPDVSWLVTFDLGVYGTHCGGGALEQEVRDGASAIAPEVQTVDGVRFNGWSVDISCITSRVTVAARYVNAQGEPMPRYYVDAAIGDDDQYDGSATNVPFATIQHALNMASDGDVIEVADGTYAPVEYYQNKNVTVRSMNGAEFTVIDGGDVSRCVHLNWNNQAIAFKGFTLCNGYGNIGGCVYGGTFLDCIIRDSTATNNCAYGGGAAYATLLNCLILDNTCVGLYGAYGGGAYDCEVYNCTIVGNDVEAEGYYTACGGVQNCQVYNSIIWDNTASTSYAYQNGGGWDSTASWSGDRQTISPRFVDAANGDYRLYAKSPCLNAGYNSYVQTATDLAGHVRIQDGTVDMGAYEGGILKPAQTPCNVEVSDNAPGKIVLTWDEAPCADAYRVYRSTQENLATAQLVATVTNVCNYVDAGVSSEHPYYYWMTAFNDLGESAASGVVVGQCGEPLKLVTTKLDVGMELVAYGSDGEGFQFEATGGSGEYKWEIQEGFTACDYGYRTYAETGTAMGWQEDEGEWYVSLPFNFSIAGCGTARGVYVTSNGSLRFSYSKYEEGEEFNPLGEDLRTDCGGDIYVENADDHVTIRWDACRYGAEDEAYRFAMTLYPDGRIDMHYGSCGGELAALKNVVMTYRYCILPEDMSFDESGLLCGTPTSASTNTFCVVCRDVAYSDESVMGIFDLVIASNPNSRPAVDAQTPSDMYLSIRAGESLTLSVAAHDPEGKELTYQWYVDYEPIEDATNVTYTLATQVDDVYPEGVTIYCQISDDLWQDENAVKQFWHVSVTHEYHPDANDPLSLRELCNNTEFAWGDIVYVAPGRYAPFKCYAESYVRFIATGGPDETFIDGNLDSGYGLCFRGDCGPEYLSLEGFTLENGCGGAAYATLIDCVIRNCTGDEGGGGAYECSLNGCYVYGNSDGQFGAAYRCTLTNCTVYGNVARTDENPVGGVGYCHVYDSIIVGNGIDIGFYEDEEDEAGSYVVRNSCIGTSWPGEGNISEEPKFVNARAGDFRLRTGSPCLNPRMGAYRGEAVAGYVVSAEVVGNGQLDKLTDVVTEGGSVTFTVSANSPRPIAYFELDGERIVGVTSVTLSNVARDRQITAVFASCTFYVDAENGDDDNDGLTVESAKASIQAAVALACSGEKVWVADGTYAPFAFTADQEGVIVESVNGSSSTFIDGGCTNRCVTGDGDTYDRQTTHSIVRGLTLMNGCAPVVHKISRVEWEDSCCLSVYSRGGGAAYCQLEDCVVQDCQAVCGGGLYCCVAERTVIVGNVATTEVLDGVLDDLIAEYEEKYGEISVKECLCAGGGSYYSDLRFCTVVSNESGEYGGGVYYGTAANSILWNNAASNGCDGYFPDCSNCCVSDDDCCNGDLYLDDPQFADEGGYDFRLLTSSPYVDAGKAWLGAYATPYCDSVDTPTGLGVSTDLEGVIEVWWDEMENATSYRIYRYIRPDDEKAVCIAEVTDTYYEDRDIEATPMYFYWVQAVNAEYESDWTDYEMGYCFEESEIEEIPGVLNDMEGEGYADFSAWLVSNEVVTVEATNYRSQVLSAGRALDAKNKPLWQDYIAGTDPYDEESEFTATVEIVDGVPEVRWSPRLSPEQEQRRVYTTWGEKTLGDGKTDVSNLTDAERQEQGYRFFQVDVNLRP